jgi:hypothetical protein
MSQQSAAEKIALSILVTIILLALRAGIFVGCFNHLAAHYGFSEITFVNAIFVVVGFSSLIPSCSNG